MINSRIPADKRHIAFSVLFLTEMWERFSSFGLRSLLVLYFVQSWHWSDQKSYAVFGVYVTLLCVTPVLGGYLSDRVLGRRNTTLLGACLIMLGHLCITFLSNTQFMLGITNIIVGTGLMVPSMCSLVGMLYADDKLRHDRAFTYFYMGINVGGILAGVLVGFVAYHFGWHAGFSLAAIGMLIALATFLFGWRYLHPYVQEPHRTSLTQLRAVGVAGVLSFLILGFYYLLNHPQYIQYLVLGMIMLSIFLFVKLFRVADFAVKKNLWVLVILYAMTVCFFIMYEQSGTSLMLFTERVIDRSIGQYSVPTPVVTALNPIYIIVFTPLIAAIWVWLAARRCEPKVIVKVALGLILTAVGFLLLAHAASLAHPNLFWLALAILFTAIGELFIGPVVLAAVSELAPAQFNSTLMGIWFMMGSIATYMAVGVAKLTSVTNADAVGGLYEPIFRSVGYYGLALGMFALVASALYRLYSQSQRVSSDLATVVTIQE